MDKKLLEKTGAAAFGSIWQSDLSRALGVNDRTIRRWLKDNSTPDRIRGELISLLTIRKQEIDNTISLLSASDPKTVSIDWNAKLFTISDNGDLIDEFFETIDDAKAWVIENWSDDDYQVSYYEMTVAEHYAISVIRHYADVYDPDAVLSTIRDTAHNASNKTEQEIFEDLACLSDAHYGREYYIYYLSNELSLHNRTNFDDEGGYFGYDKTKSYKEWLLSKLASHCNFLADLN